MPLNERPRDGRATWRRWVRPALLGVACALTLLLAYGTLVEPRLILDRRTLEVTLPRLPAGAQPSVAVFSDLQVGMWGANTGMVERVVDDVVRRRPNGAVVAGDLVYSASPDPADQAAEVARLLAPLPRAGIPTYAVLGNHDHAVDAVDELAAALDAVGVGVLRNEAVPLPGPAPDIAAVHLVGLGAHVPGRTDAAAALAEVPDDAPRLVVMHNPVSFRTLPPGSAPVAVAGHTHCGQVALPGLPVWESLELRADERLALAGWAPEGYGAAGNALFVTCGIGFSRVPVRIGAPPQVVYVQLGAPAAAGGT